MLSRVVVFTVILGVGCNRFEARRELQAPTEAPKAAPQPSAKAKPPGPSSPPVAEPAPTETDIQIEDLKPLPPMKVAESKSVLVLLDQTTFLVHEPESILLESKIAKQGAVETLNFLGTEEGAKLLARAEKCTPIENEVSGKDLAGRLEAHTFIHCSKKGEITGRIETVSQSHGRCGFAGGRYISTPELGSVQVIAKICQP